MGHTPGPWHYGHSILEDPAFYIWPQSEMDRTPGNRDWLSLTASDFPEQEANARLIAAAPDLLEALRNLEKYACLPAERYYDLFLSAIKKARVAIVKAED